MKKKEEEKEKRLCVKWYEECREYEEYDNDYGCVLICSDSENDDDFSDNVKDDDNALDADDKGNDDDEDDSVV